MTNILQRSKFAAAALFIFATMLQVAIAPLVAPAKAAAFTGAGEGTISYPFRITNCGQLQSINTSPGSYYVIMNDIDCSATSGWNSGAGFAPIINFSGNLDGRYHSISGLTINRTSTKNVGFISNMNGGTVQNINFTSLSVQGGNNNVGGLAASIDGGTVTNVNLAGNVTGGSVVAGLAGTITSGTVVNKSSYTGTVSNTSSWGAGLVTFVTNSTISNSYFSGTETGTNSSAGIASSVSAINGNSSNITNNYVVGTINDLNYRAAIVNFLNVQNGGQMTVSGNFTVASGMNGSNPAGLPMFSRIDSGTVQSSNNFYDHTVAGADYCATLNCSSVNTDGSDPNHFKNTNSVAPLNSWDFNLVWQKTANYPTLLPDSLTLLNNLSVPDPVTNVRCTTASGQLFVNWTDPEVTGHSQLLNTKVQYKHQGDSSWTDAGSSQYGNLTVGALPNNENYYARVIANNAVGDAIPVECGPILIGEPPSPPQNFNVTNLGLSNITGQVGIVWSPPVSAGSSPITNYYVSYSVAGQNNWSSAMSTGMLGNAVLTGFTNGRYDFKMWAVNSNGASDEVFVYNQFIGDQDYSITNCQQLQNIANEPSGDYTLANDIDCTGTVNWNDGEGFLPITGFDGTLNGQGHTINGLYINRDTWNLGLFNDANNAEIYNLHLTNINYSGYGDIGGVAVSSYNTTYDNVTVQGIIHSNYTVGGLVGYIENDSDGPVNIANSSTDITIHPYGDNNEVETIGGLIGYYYGESGGQLSVSTSTANLVFNNDGPSDSAGGLIGYAQTYDYSSVNISEVNANSNLTVGDSAGGLIGYFYAYNNQNYLSIDKAEVNSTIEGYSNLGGLIGVLDSGALQASITRTHSQGNINAFNTESNNFGGFIGQASGNTENSELEISDSYSDMNVTSTGANIGGLLGYNNLYTTIHDAFYKGNLVSAVQAGGMVGLNEGYLHLDKVYTAGSNAGNQRVGGLVGVANGSTVVENSFSSMATSGIGVGRSDQYNIGGILGTGIENYINNVYIDAQASTGTNCYGDRGNDEGCGVVNFEGEDANFFINNTSNPPLDQWDFSNLWLVHEDALPTLRSFVPAPATPINLTSSRETSSRVFLNWQQPVGGTVDHYVVQYKASDQGDESWTYYNKLDSPTATSVTINGLANSTSYDFRVIAINNLEIDSEWSDTYTVSTKAQQYEITNCDQLQDINGDIQGEYTLNADIDCSDTVNWNGGHGFWPIATNNWGQSFSGTLNGLGYSVYGLTINRTGDNDDSSALFLNVYGATIQNLDLSGDVTARYSAAGLADFAYNTHISNVHSAVNVTTVNDGEVCTGGLLGCYGADWYDTGSISNSSSSGEVSGKSSVGGLVGYAYKLVMSHSYSTSYLIGTSSVGGLVGSINDSFVADAYNRGGVYASNETSNVGGLFGTMSSTLAVRTYSSALVLGDQFVGGLVGTSYNSQFQDSFSESAVSGGDSNSNGAVVGSDGGGTVLINIYFDQQRNGQERCVGNYDTYEGCVVFNQDSLDQEHYYGTTTAAPLDEWDFNGVWVMHDNDWPTLAGVPFFPIEVGIKAQTTTNSITVSWSDIDANGSPITGYELQWSEDGVNMHSVDVSADATSSKITGLKPNTKYYFSFRAFNGYGASKAILFFTFTKPLDAPASAPAVVVVSSKNAPRLQAEAKDEQPAGSVINLDDFSEYSAGKGKSLKLKVGQVVHFTITKDGVKEDHTATVKEIGDGYVILTIASTPFDVKIFTGQTMPISIEGQHALDIA